MLISLNQSPMGCQPDSGGMERVTPEQRRQYRAIGGRLALYVRQQQGGLPPVSTLLAVAADFAGEQNCAIKFSNFPLAPLFILMHDHIP